MEFEKENNRYKKTPRQRILDILKDNDNISPTKLHKLTKMNYMHMKFLLHEMESENTIEIQRFTAGGKEVLSISKKEVNKNVEKN